MTSVGDAVSASLKKLGLTDQAAKVRMMGVWREAVGSRIADKTQPYGFNRGVLTIKTSSAAWQNELTFLKQDLVNRLNKALGRMLVKDIRVISGTLFDVRDLAPKPEWLKAPPRKEELQTASKTASVINDPEIRSAFAQLMELDRRAHRVVTDKK